jgi:superfamily II DNA helicase RecQ
MSVLEETNGKAIIWANYRRDIENIKLALQKEYGMTAVATYYGDTEDEEREQAVENFQNANMQSLDFLLATHVPAAMV